MPGNPHAGTVRPGDVSFIMRFVGEVVAMVITETPAATRDGAERIAVSPRKKA